MKIRELLDRLDDVALESLAADKIDDVIHLRLPREVLIDEIADTIASYIESPFPSLLTRARGPYESLALRW